MSGAVSTKETMFLQESIKPLENEALKKDGLPGTSSVTPEMPQQIPSSDPLGQTPPEINY